MKQNYPKAFSLFVLICTLFFHQQTHAQKPQKPNAAEIQLALNKLNVLGSVLYVAAHPDDENTRLISWLANERLYRTGYLSATRGDGGQNLIGTEIRELLGIIRTQELLQARRTDGGEQFFTRANDFGFSKNPAETFTIWDKEQVLADVVWTIRKFRPDVIITRFSPEPGNTHGHHTASAMLAMEAFDAAADPNRFPEQLQYVETWQPTRIFWNTSSFFFSSEKDFNTEGLLHVDVGMYSPLLGKSYTEISAESRSMHKSQGFGSAGTRGTTKEYLKPLKGSPVKQDMFEGINTSWSRVKGGDKVGKLLKKAAVQFNPQNPAASVPQLQKAQAALEGLPESYWKKQKLKELQQVIKACLGLYIEAVSSDYAAAPGDRITLNLEAVNRSGAQVVLKKVSFPFDQFDTLANATLENNKPFNLNRPVQLPEGTPFSQPYWLRRPGTEGMFAVDEQQLIGLPESPPAAVVKVQLQVNSRAYDFEVPVVYKRTDPVEGEQYRPFVVTPPVFVNIAEKVYMFADHQPKTVQVRVQAGRNNTSGKVALQLPGGWRAEPESLPFALQLKGQEEVLNFNVYSSSAEKDGIVKAVAAVDGKTYEQGLTVIAYNHIPTQTLFPPATARVTELDLQKRGERIGYLMGAGDEVPAALQQIGYKVTLLNLEDLQPQKLKQYQAVIIGVRAYNTLDRLKFYQPALLAYVKGGGNVIVQYNTSAGLVTNELGPYPLKLSRDRVTVENAPVTLLKPEHPLLNRPNKITAKDFENWVQERGLYFPNEWAPEYEALLSSNDPGETPKEGGLLVAKYGRGNFIYTGYSWFRQLPAGVPGAYRIFTNLISAE